jgi:3',5'-cyclic AMP phosphodiesterase CpdA
MGPREDVSADQQSLSYTFENKGYRFLVLDSCGRPEIDPQGYLSEDQLKLLRKEAVAAGPPLVLFIHHPLLSMDSPWMDANMLVVNGQTVHEALLPARGRLRGVFFGHIHQSTQTLRDGILYVAAASTYSQLTSWPADEIVQHAYDEPPGFNLVRLTSEQTMVRQHRFARP